MSQSQSQTIKPQMELETGNPSASILVRPVSTVVLLHTVGWDQNVTEYLSPAEARQVATMLHTAADQAERAELTIKADQAAKASQNT